MGSCTTLMDASSWVGVDVDNTIIGRNYDKKTTNRHELKTNSYVEFVSVRMSSLLKKMYCGKRYCGTTHCRNYSITIITE